MCKLAFIQKRNAIPRVKGFVGCKVIRNGSCGFSKHIGHNGIRRDVADRESVLKAVFLATFHSDQFGAIAGKLPQNADGLVGDKATFYKAKAKQVVNPLGVFLIILISLDGLHPLGIGCHNMKTALLENVKHGNSVFPGGFHTDIQTIILVKSVGEAVQLGIERGKAFLLIARLQTAIWRGNDGNDQKALAHINATANRIYDLQTIKQ